MVIPLCAKCGKNHDDKCLTGTSASYICVMHGHQYNNFPTLADMEKENKQNSS